MNDTMKTILSTGFQKAFTIFEGQRVTKCACTDWTDDYRHQLMTDGASVWLVTQAGSDQGFAEIRRREIERGAEVVDGYHDSEHCNRRTVYALCV